MCTVTIVPKPDWQNAFRMACSRDESHGRPAAEPPIKFGKPDYAGQRWFLMPTDPSSGGTWVGVNDAGLALTLLNYNLPDPPTGRDMSRGSVIPALLQATTIQQAMHLAGSIERQRMMPFRLVACDGESVMLWRSTEPIEQVCVECWDKRPVMFTSSGLGDHVVEPPRRDLFDQWFGSDRAAYIDEQAGFHQHQWPGKEHLSVCMHREDARTVSYTTVDVEPNAITMRYYPDRPDRQAEPTVVGLEPRLAGQ